MPLSLYSASGVECALELLWRTMGVRLDPTAVICSTESTDAENARLILQSRTQTTDGRPAVYSGQSEFHYRKFPLPTILPHDLAYDGEYPLSFTRLQTFMKFSYDFKMEENEFALEKPDGQLTAPLKTGDTIEGPLHSQNYLVLRVTEHSTRWIAGGAMRLKMIPLST